MPALQQEGSEADRVAAGIPLLEIAFLRITVTVY
jgi:hypothetical protein